MDGENVSLLKEATKYVMDRHAFKLDAYVILPDHLHCVWTLPEGDNDYSNRWMLIKSYFSRKCDLKYKPPVSDSRIRKKEQAIWQRRFWEHQFRDEADFARHIEYIHYNPVKHGLVDAPFKWAYSSFHRYVKEGVYEKEWASGAGIRFPKGIGNE